MTVLTKTGDATCRALQTRPLLPWLPALHCPACAPQVPRAPWPSGPPPTHLQPLSSLSSSPVCPSSCSVADTPSLSLPQGLCPFCFRSLESLLCTMSSALPLAFSLERPTTQSVSASLSLPVLCLTSLSRNMYFFVNHLSPLASM